MQPECLAYHELPHTTRLFADYTGNFAAVSGFYPCPPPTIKELSDLAARLQYPQARRASVAALLERQNRCWGASEATLKNIQRFCDGACAFVTGQQVALFGGPLFAIHKALTAIRYAAELSRAGIDCVPVFWLAMQDHDFAEVSHATLLSTAGALSSFSISSMRAEGSAVGGIPLGAQTSALAQQAAALLGGGEAGKLLQRCYTPEETLGSAYARLFTALFSTYGLILIDPMDDEAHTLAAPLLKQALEATPEVNRALLERGQALEAAGYHQQVKVTNSTTLLFGAVDGARTPIRRSNGEYVLGQKKYSTTELAQRITDHPQEFSASALLRPVLQDYLLPTVAYTGGPAEVAYFAQSGVVYQKLLGRVTPILPRFSATLLDARAQRLLQQYGFSLHQLLRSQQDVKQLLSARSLPAALQQTFEQATQSFESSISSLAQSLQKLDPTLEDAARHAGSKMRYQLQKLHGRAARAQLRHEQELSRHADVLSNSLFPNRNLQEREIAGISYVGQFGSDLLPRLYEALQVSCAGHQVISL